MSSTLRLLLGVLLLFPFVLSAQGKKNRSTAPMEMTPLPAVPAMPDAFPQVVGTQAFGPAYKFTKDDAVLEAAKGISAMGSRILKINAVSGQQLTPYIGMPFTHYVLWYRSSNEWTKGFTPELRRREYNAVYLFTKDLLTRYDTAGKTFFLGHWEGDWYLLPDKDVKKDASPELTSAMIEWLNVRQKAVDDARSEVPYSKCRVYTYAEVNRVRDAMKDGRKRMTNVVLPKVNVDFVSYSAYDCQLLPAEEVRATLDYVNAQLPPKAGLPVKRVFIGECGLSWKVCEGDGAKHDQRNRELLVKFLTWKPAMVLFWQYYNNEVVDGEQVGFWLVDHKNKKTPLHASLTELFAAQEEAAKEMRGRMRRLPSYEEMAVFSENWLRVRPAR
jgi:hypothetical protein